MKTISALAIIVAMSLSLPLPASAQQTVGSNGAVLDGMGAGGNPANMSGYDGPPNADVTSMITAVPKARGEGYGRRRNSCNEFGIYGNCRAPYYTRHWDPSY